VKGHRRTGIARDANSTSAEPEKEAQTRVDSLKIGGEKKTHGTTERKSALPKGGSNHFQKNLRGRRNPLIYEGKPWTERGRENTGPRIPAGSPQIPELTNKRSKKASCSMNRNLWGAKGGKNRRTSLRREEHKKNRLSLNNQEVYEE